MNGYLKTTSAKARFSKEKKRYPGREDLPASAISDESRSRYGIGPAGEWAALNHRDCSE